MKPRIEEACYGNLFTWKDLENVINIRPLMRDNRIFILGDHGEKWVDVNRWTSDPSCFPPTLLRKIIDKYVCHFTDVSRFKKELNDFCAELESEYKRSVDAQIFLCRNLDIKDHPFGAHYDRNNNVIVQCEGITNWKVWDYIDESDSNNKLKYDIRSDGSNHMKDLGDPIIDFDLKPGDALWIPKQYPHLATSKSKRMSISFAWQDDVIPQNTVLQDRNWITI
tara:strand:+ start:276 stop:944 length:669 start_codon:yes stop_codon:yes gene_type:complete